MVTVRGKAKPEKIIMGIDPGTNLMGYAILRMKGNKAEMLAFGVIQLKKYESHYLRLGKIHERVTSIIDSYHPDEVAIEAPFYGKNVQSMLKLGRAQGVAICAAIQRDIPISEYEPKRIKMAITGNGAASKEQVAAMLQRMLNISDEIMHIQLMLLTHWLRHIATLSKWGNQNKQERKPHGKNMWRNWREKKR